MNSKSGGLGVTMIDGKPDFANVQAVEKNCRRKQYGILCAMCMLVIGVYAYTAQSGLVASNSLNPADAYYNLLVRSFRAGQLNLIIYVPGFAQLANPYDPAAHAPYRVLDMSYYKGKFYLYFGVTPALVLFWPYVVLTGHYLPQKAAAICFCSIGFLAGVGLLCALWRRYFAEVNVAMVSAGALAMGLVTCVPFLLARCDVYEVAISCGYAFTMLALLCIWKAIHDLSRQTRWLAGASLMYGLAVGARPSLLFGAIVLLVPVIQAWREQRKVWVPLLAALGPIALVGLGLMFYNVLRFDNPFEFGFRYQLAGDRQLTQQPFSFRYLWFNFRAYFLETARWSTRFPFVRNTILAPSPPGHGPVEQTFGILVNIPLVWLALAVPLARRGRSPESRYCLDLFLSSAALLFGIAALTLGFYYYTAGRYEVEFMPVLVLLAVIGILGAERDLGGQPGRRRAMRWGWSVLLAFSVAFNLLACTARWADSHDNIGMALQAAGRPQEAIGQFDRALRLNPDFAQAHYNLGLALESLGRTQEAVEHYEQAIRIQPDYGDAHNNLAGILRNQGRLPEAINHYEQAARSKPNVAGVHFNFGSTLEQAGRVDEAIGQYEQAIRIQPDFAFAHNNLGVLLMSRGRLQEAVDHYQQALRIQPDNEEAHFNLALASSRLGRWQEAIDHYQRVVRIKPDLLQARRNLANALLQAGKVPEAIDQFQLILHIQPNDVDTHNNLGLALEFSGRLREAAAQYERALQIKPDFAQAQTNLARVRAIQ